MAAPKFAPIQELTFNVKTDSYATFISTLREALAGKNPDKVRERPVLGKQTGETVQPPRWIYVVLKGDDGVAPKVGIRSDNAYIYGFANRPKGSTEDKWFQLSPRDSTTQLFKGAKMLGFTGHYKTLVGGQGIKDLPKLILGRKWTLEAANILWEYKQDKLSDAAAADGGVGDPQENLKRKLALLAVTLCEAARFEPARSVIDGGWEKSISITSKEVRYLKDWGDLSTALLAWKADDYKNDKKHFASLPKDMGVTTGAKAIAVVQLVLNKPPKMGLLLAWLRTCWGCWSGGHAEGGGETTLQGPDGAGKAMPQGNKSSSIVNPLY